MVNNELQHHGILGMKWGIRRYQNKDGTLTKAGQRRYNKEMDKLKAEEKILKAKKRTQAKLDKLDQKRKELDEMRESLPEYKKKQKEVKSDNHTEKRELKDIPTDELNAIVNRLRLEQSYVQLTPKKVSFGKKIMQDVVGPALAGASKNLLSDFTTKVGKSILGLEKKEDPSEALKKAVMDLNNKKRYKELTGKEYGK